MSKDRIGDDDKRSKEWDEHFKKAFDAFTKNIEKFTDEGLFAQAIAESAMLVAVSVLRRTDFPPSEAVNMLSRCMETAEAFNSEAFDEEPEGDEVGGNTAH